jgi:hypothetical protein
VGIEPDGGESLPPEHIVDDVAFPDGLGVPPGDL